MALTRKLTKSLTRSLTRKLTGAELQQLFLEKFKLTVSDTERITNNFFSNTSGWVASETSTTGISGGKMVLNNASNAQAFYFDNATEAGKSYEVKFIISDYSSGGIRIRFPEDTDRVYNANGNYTAIITANTSSHVTRLTFTIVGTTTLKVDNVFVKEASKPPIAAFSLRKLGNVSPYAARIRRSSDNTEAQVMFDASDRVSEASGVRNTSMNLVDFSEDFGNSFWTKSAVSMFEGFSDPTGGTNAYKAIPSKGSSFHFVHNSSDYTVVSGKTYTYSIHLKADGYNFVTLNAPTGNSKGNAGPRVNLATGQKDGFYSADHDLHVEQLEDGWYRVSTQYVASGTFLRVDHGIFPTNAHAAYAGDGNNGVLFWGAQLEETTTYESVGTEKVTDGGFDDATQWAKSSSITIASGQAGFISSAENHYLLQNIGAVNGRKYKVTVTLTDYTSGAIAVRYPINKTSGSDYINSVGTHTIEGIADQSNANIYFQAKGTSTTLTIDNLSVTEHKPIPSEYISTPVVSNDGLTFTETTLDDFVGGENLIPYSEDFNNNAWNPHLFGGAVQIVESNITDPFGGTGSHIFTSHADGIGSKIQDNITTTAGKYFISVFLKKGTTDSVQLGIIDQGTTSIRVEANLTNGTTSTAVGSPSDVSIEAVGSDGWYRVSFAYTFPAGGSDTFQLYSGSSSSTGDNFYAFGYQVNSDSLKKYQKTSGTARDGNASVVVLYNQTGGEDIIQPQQETSSKQPLLYKAGLLVKANSSPAIQFDGIDDLMTFSPDEFGNGLNLNSLSSFLVFKADYIAGFDYVFNLGTDTNDKDWFLPFINSGDFVVRYGTNSNSGTTGNTNVNLMSGVAGHQSGKFKAFLNGTQTDIRDVQSNSSTTGIASVGGLEGTSNQFEGKILEIIVFDTEQHTTREAIEADIADFHNITLS